MIYKSLLPSTSNTRELGGLKTSEGSLTKTDRIWRSDAPTDITEDDINILLRHNITTVIDIRTEKESEQTPEKLADIKGLDFFHIPIAEGSVPPETLDEVPLSYMETAGAENIADVFKTIAKAENGVLFHCAAGKDRTGVVSAVILLSCSVPADVIAANYALSREYNKKRLEKYLSEHPEKDSRVVTANEISMYKFIELFYERYGSVSRYFSEIGLSEDTLSAIRNKLL